MYLYEEKLQKLKEYKSENPSNHFTFGKFHYWTRFYAYSLKNVQHVDFVIFNWLAAQCECKFYVLCLYTGSYCINISVKLIWLLMKFNYILQQHSVSCAPSSSDPAQSSQSGGLPFGSRSNDRSQYNSNPNPNPSAGIGNYMPRNNYFDSPPMAPPQRLPPIASGFGLFNQPSNIQYSPPSPYQYPNSFYNANGQMAPFWGQSGFAAPNPNPYDSQFGLPSLRWQPQPPQQQYGQHPSPSPSQFVQPSHFASSSDNRLQPSFSRMSSAKTEEHEKKSSE